MPFKRDIHTVKNVLCMVDIAAFVSTRATTEISPHGASNLRTDMHIITLIKSVNKEHLKKRKKRKEKKG